MRDTDIANAGDELKNCKTALEVWASDNDSSKIEAKTKRFARKKANQSTRLEKV